LHIRTTIATSLIAQKRASVKYATGISYLSIQFLLIGRVLYLLAPVLATTQIVTVRHTV